MDTVVLLVVGLAVGAVGRAIVPGRQEMPLWLTLLIGVGALLLVGLALDSLLLQVVVGSAVAAGLIAVAAASQQRHTRR